MNKTSVSSQDGYMALSIEMLEALKNNQSVEPILETFAQSTLEDIAAEIDTDQERYAFWINIYNAYIVSVLRKDPKLYEDRRNFFKQPHVRIAGRDFSFAEIEHGVIRRSQKEYFLGYVGHMFPPAYQKKLRPAKRDYRVHFALNCGAKSCPPVAILKPENLGKQLDQLSNAYLKMVTSYDATKGAVITTPLFSWFRGDFGGKSGVKKILKQKELIPSLDVDLNYGPYDWTLDLDNYIETE